MNDSQLIYEAYQQGLDTHWQDGDIDITLSDVLKLTSEPVNADPSQFKNLLINVSRDEKRIDNADLIHPIVVTRRGGKATKILDGQHRIVKAIKTNQPISVRYLELDNAPEEYQQMFS